MRFRRSISYSVENRVAQDLTPPLWRRARAKLFILAKVAKQTIDVDEIAQRTPQIAILKPMRRAVQHHVDGRQYAKLGSCERARTPTAIFAESRRSRPVGGKIGMVYIDDGAAISKL